MQLDASLRSPKEPQAHSLAELLACPPSVGSLLNGGAQTIDYDTGDVIFRQGTDCLGLYVVVSGQLLRKAERRNSRLILGSVRAGHLVELAAALGDGHHTYTLVGQSAGSLLLLKRNALQEAFRAHPPLRMQLLKELAREVSRAYIACRATRTIGLRRRGAGTAHA